MKTEDQLTDKIRELFPRIPRRLARGIAHFATLNPRPGRNGAHADRATRLVAAFVRHNMTCYDTLFGQGFTKPEARQKVQPEILHYFAAWQ